MSNEKPCVMRARGDRVGRRRRRVKALALLSVLIPAGVVGGQDVSPAPWPDEPLGASVVWAGDRAPDDNEFAMMSIEDLLQVQVTSVAGVERDWFTTPAAMHVITGKDIQRTGHQHLAEALRLAPGANVSRIGSRQWDIGVRGFGNLFANKLLVLVDGRTVFDPVFSGTYWDIQDLVLEDLDRMEVIRGPGATLWGANAVNGVINVTSKPADQTQGWYTKGVIGSHIDAIGAVRYGGEIDEDTHFRVWTKYTNHDNFEFTSGADYPDAWDMVLGGFRLDHEGDDGVHLTLDTGFHHSDRLNEGNVVPVAAPPGTAMAVANRNRATGGFATVRLAREQEDTGWSLQAYYMRDNRVSGNGSQFDRDTAELDWRHRFRWGGRDEHELIWGLAYHLDAYESEDGTNFTVRPRNRELHKVSGFVQDTWTLVDDRLYFMIGSKFEHNDRTGYEVQPSARLWWTPDERQTFWAAASRPVRVPDASDDDLALTIALFDFPGPGPILALRIVGDDRNQSEQVTTLEAGYRVRLSDEVVLDFAGFYSRYDNLITTMPIGGIGDMVLSNAGHADSYGGEASLVWNPTDRVRFETCYSLVQVDFGPGASGLSNQAPRHQAKGVLSYQVTDEFELNTAAYYMDNPPNSPGIDSYIRLDAGVTWRPTDDLELSVWAQHLLDPHHPEGTDSSQAGVVEVPRSVYVQATWRF